MRPQSGFTTIELITIIIIVGILAVVALPRLGGADTRGNVFRDQTVSALRYAQKTAVSHRRTVCVTFTPAAVSLQIDADNNGACDTDLLLPGSQANAVQSGDQANASFNPQPANFNFLPNGTGQDRNVVITDQAAIVVTGATGYVN